MFRNCRPEFSRWLSLWPRVIDMWGHFCLYHSVPCVNLAIIVSRWVCLSDRLCCEFKEKRFLEVRNHFALTTIIVLPVHICYTTMFLLIPSAPPYLRNLLYDEWVHWLQKFSSIWKMFYQRHTSSSLSAASTRLSSRSEFQMSIKKIILFCPYFH